MSKVLVVLGAILAIIGAALWATGWVEAARHMTAWDAAVRVATANGFIAAGFGLIGIYLSRIVRRRLSLR